jgi:hypothetical protein
MIEQIIIPLLSLAFPAFWFLAPKLARFLDPDSRQIAIGIPF